VFDGLTLLDLAGIYEPVTRLKYAGFIPDMSWDICAIVPIITEHGGLKITPNQVNNDLSVYDAIIVPGGKGAREIIHNDSFIKWIQSATNVTWKISVCTGSLILGAAGFLRDRKATTHFDAYELLSPFCKEVVEDRIVEDGDCISAGAVTSSIDLGLYLCRKWAGGEADIMIRYKMDYKG
ncbi:MAG: DJ-1/PfpI family protein, partial [Chitinophagaceae bacterium]